MWGRRIFIFAIILVLLLSPKLAAELLQGLVAIITQLFAALTQTAHSIGKTH